MGTWHRWKFLPILGEYAVSMLKGELGEEERERWSWDRELGKAVREDLRELKDIEGYHGTALYGSISQINRAFKYITNFW